MRIGIIGGGPGGSITAATLAKAGHQVVLFESEIFPRFHIGESLLPCNLLIYEELGITSAVMHAGGYMPKLAAFFEQAGSAAGGAPVRVARFPFARALAGDPPSIFQVERSRFDKLLLDRAVALGAELRCPATVKRVELPEQSGTERPVIHAMRHPPQAVGQVVPDEDAIGLQRRAAEVAVAGEPERHEVDFVVDASGRDTLLARQLGLMDRHGDLMRAAVFGHIGHLPLVPGAETGDIVISKASIGWAWQIPLRSDKWSVGLVLKRDQVQKAAGGPSGVFRSHIHHFPELEQRLAGRIPEPCRSIPNISYRVCQRIGRRWALLGDAGGFADPPASKGNGPARCIPMSSPRLRVRARAVEWGCASFRPLPCLLMVPLHWLWRRLRCSALVRGRWCGKSRLLETTVRCRCGSVLRLMGIRWWSWRD